MGKTETDGIGLLELISSKAGCMYLSDLRQPGLLSIIRSVVRDISPEQYSLWEWNDAAVYITGEKVFFRNQKQAAVFLQSYKNKFEEER